MQLVDYGSGEYPFDYTKQLPYTIPEDEATNWLTQIRTRLAGHLAAGDWLGCLRWTRSLNHYIVFNYPLDRAARAEFSTILYALITSDAPSAGAIHEWTTLLLHISRKEHRLDPSDMTLPWRPLYGKMKRVLLDKRRRRSFLFKKTYDSPLTRLPTHMSNFFPSDSTQEILDEFIPSLYFPNLDITESALQWLCQFLPTTLTSARVFLPHVFRLWPHLTHSDSWDVDLLDLLGRVAKHIKGDVVDLGLTQGPRHTQAIDAIHRFFRVPVGTMPGRGLFSYVPTSNDCDATVIGRIVETSNVASFFLIYTIVPGESLRLRDGQEPGSLGTLGDLLRAHETYFHPSNHGPWTSPLFNFLHGLCGHLYGRLLYQTSDKYNCADNWKLLPEDLTLFSEWIQPLAYLGLFGKDNWVTHQCQSILRYLMFFSPETVAPKLLSHSYHSLSTEAVTETHRTPAILGTLGACAKPLFSRTHYPQGGRHLMPLLYLALPGLDTNDAGKTRASCLFIAGTALGIRFEDASILQSTAGDGPSDEEDEACRLSTGEMAQWLSEFISRVWAILESVPEREEGSFRDTQVQSVLTMIKASISIVLAQCSQGLLGMLRRLVLGWVEETVLSRDTMQDVGLLCGLLTRLQGSEPFVELCKDRILEELEGGAGGDVGGHGGAARRERSLLWFLHILHQVIGLLKDPNASLPYAQDLQDLLLIAMDRCRSRSSVQASSQLLAYWLRQLVEIELMEARAIVGEEEEKEHYRHWHTSIPMEILRQGQVGAGDGVQWKIPTTAALNQAIQLIRDVVEVAVDKMQNVIESLEGDGKGGRKDLILELERYIPWIVAGIDAMGTLVPEDEDLCVTMFFQAHDAQDLEQEEQAAEPRFFTGAKSGNAKGLNPEEVEYVRKLRHRIGRLVTHATYLLVSQYPGEVYVLSSLSALAVNILVERGMSAQEVESNMALQGFRRASWAGEGDLDRKRGSRFLLVYSVGLYHHRRIAYNASRQGRGVSEGILKIRTDLVHALIAIGTSDYTEVQNAGARGLKQLVNQCRTWREVVIEGSLQVVESYKKGEDIRVEGALRLLAGITTCSRACGREWRWMIRWVPAFLRLEEEEKAKFQAMVKQAYDYLEDKVSHHWTLWNLKCPKTLGTQGDNAWQRDTISAWARKHEESMVTRLEGLVKDWIVQREDENVRGRQQLVRWLESHWTKGAQGWRYRRRVLEMTGRVALSLGGGRQAEVVTGGDNEEEPEMIVTRMAMEAMTSEVSWIRRSGAQVLEKLLLVLKELGNQGSKTKYWHHSPTPYSLAEDKGSKKLYQDKVHLGWKGTWPTSGYKVYSEVITWDSPKAYISFDPDSFGEKILAYLVHQLQDAGWWRRYLHLQIQEAETGGGKGGGIPGFSSSAARLYSTICKCLGAQVGNEGLLPIVQEVVREATGEGAHQKVASEALAGLMRGSKHWGREDRGKLWESVSPLLSRVFSLTDSSVNTDDQDAGGTRPLGFSTLLTPETLRHWGSFLRFSLEDRDPLRNEPLIRLVLRGTYMDRSTDAGFLETSKLLFRRTLVKTLTWRLEPYLDEVRAFREAWLALDHPFLQVRRVIGDILALYQIVSEDSVVLGEEKVMLIEAQQSGKNNIEFILYRLAEMTDRPVVQGSSDYRNACQTVLQWAHACLTRPYPTHWALSHVPQLLPFILGLLELSDDTELQDMVTKVLADIAQYPYPDQEGVRAVVEVLLRGAIQGPLSTQQEDMQGGKGCTNTILLTHSSWHIRDRTLQMLQVLVFRKLTFLDLNLRERVVRRVAEMLGDEQVEVRKRAADTLAGLIRCCPSVCGGDEGEGRGMIDRLKGTFEATLNRVSVPRSRKRAFVAKADRGESDVEQEERGRKRQLAIQERHSAILGLSCLIKAYPYEVPLWMPECLVLVAKGSNDPEPIQSTVRETFNSFKRTHQDTWVLDREQFTEDQLVLLSDLLVSPSYYV
ncbi:hypothetical protein BJ684DRAFT_14332 [Piptocephalis cylindrospora]|uniref:Uncharacterized protein n=1 Tax=Piptocephalis cylindrospora TaxID=1907219 RepID=A0A4P9Y9A8_9FUNG|nr:hypothetical protein BJ684DRAFT_14332 [Piptocephalis cylindrospora]|eukprot:RKP15424.1 hypothetical protein BJ684DRAFT_14332 [Piptocephalis cylindrospora]